MKNPDIKLDLCHHASLGEIIVYILAFIAFVLTVLGECGVQRRRHCRCERCHEFVQIYLQKQLTMSVQSTFKFDKVDP